MYSELIYQVCPMSLSHRTSRSKKVDAVVIHYAAAVVADASRVVAWWERQNAYTSANYLIDVEGRITGVIPEEFRPYTSGSWGLGTRDIDDHAITIECSCAETNNWSIGQKTLEALYCLMADIGHRYDIWWRYTGDESGNVHAHRWYEATPCPGEWLYSRLEQITEMANFYRHEEEERMTTERRLTTLEEHTLPIYNSLNEIPEWGKQEIGWLMGNGYLKGTEKGLELSWDELRTMVIMARALMSKEQ